MPMSVFKGYVNSRVIDFMNFNLKAEAYDICHLFEAQFRAMKIWHGNNLEDRYGLRNVLAPLCNYYKYSHILWDKLCFSPTSLLHEDSY